MPTDPDDSELRREALRTFQEVEALLLAERELQARARSRLNSGIIYRGDPGLPTPERIEQIRAKITRIAGIKRTVYPGGRDAITFQEAQALLAGYDEQANAAATADLARQSAEAKAAMWQLRAEHLSSAKIRLHHSAATDMTAYWDVVDAEIAADLRARDQRATDRHTTMTGLIDG